MTSGQSPSSSESEDEEPKVGIEDSEDTCGISKLAGAEVDERMGESKDEDAAAQMLREDRTTGQIARG